MQSASACCRWGAKDIQYEGIRAERKEKPRKWARRAYEMAVKRVVEWFFIVIVVASVSIRDQREDAYVNLDLEFWT